MVVNAKKYGRCYIIAGDDKGKHDISEIIITPLRRIIYSASLARWKASQQNPIIAFSESNSNDKTN